MMENAIVSLNNLTLGYSDQADAAPLFSGANLDIPQGQLVSLLGRNGTGKSSLLRAIAGLMKPLAGDISINGKSCLKLSVAECATLMSFVSTDSVRINGFSVWDVVALGRSPYTNWIGRLNDEDKDIVSTALEAVHVSAFAHKSIDTLSDGERQRVMIARALAQDTPVILLDEPTAFLDIPNKFEIAALLGKLTKNMGKSIIYSTHDLNVAMSLSDSMVIIDKGCFYIDTPQVLSASGKLHDIFGV